jgi:preprotein translocase subunit SecF
MKKILRFSKLFIPAAILSTVIIIAGVAGYLVRGFNLGVDFQAGLIQEVQLAPSAFSMTWSGTSSAILSFDRTSLYIVVSGSNVENKTYTFSYTAYPTIGALTQAMKQQVEGLNVTLTSPADTNSQWLLFSSLGNPYLGAAPYAAHFHRPGSAAVTITQVRDATAGLGQGVNVQNLGTPADRHFMIRVEDKEEGRVTPEQITAALESFFGNGEVVVLRSDYVGSRFSKDLTSQAGYLMALTLLLILIYASIRFKPQYAIGAVLAIMHDGIVMVAFVVWTRMEFNTTTIAAILTILGYSINNTIVVFDRIRENLKMYPDDTFGDLMNRSLSGVLSRAIITTLTTMLAVISLFIFTTGTMKDFALALLVGLISGMYTSLLIAPGFVYLWETKKLQREKRKQAEPKAIAKPAKAK